VAPQLTAKGAAKGPAKGPAVVGMGKGRTNNGSPVAITDNGALEAMQASSRYDEHLQCSGSPSGGDQALAMLAAMQPADDDADKTVSISTKASEVAAAAPEGSGGGERCKGKGKAKKGSPAAEPKDGSMVGESSVAPQLTAKGAAKGPAKGPVKGLAKGLAKCPPSTPSPPRPSPHLPPPCLTKASTKGPSKGAPKGLGKVNKKGKPGAVEPKKTKVVPRQDMKPLWWQRYLFGKDLTEGETVWAKVDDVVNNLPIDALVDRFSKVTKASGNSSCVAKPKEEKTVMKILRIVTDPNLIVGKEAALRAGDFPSAPAIADALLSMDSRVITLQRLEILKEHGCPNPAEVTQLEELRKEHPSVDFATPENLMWHLSRVPAFRVRIECWYFVRSYEEPAANYMSQLTQFQRMIDAILNSVALPRLLALVLAVGNYLNGASNDRGQADGFDIESLGKLDAVKDNTSGTRDVRHFLAELVFLGRTPSTDSIGKDDPERLVGDLLLEELRPVLCNVSRIFSHDSDGSTKVTKSVRAPLEDAEESVRALLAEFDSHQGQLQACLELSEDPADPMRLELVENFATAGQICRRLSDKAKMCRVCYGQVLEYFHHKGMTTSNFLLLWDNLLIPPDLIINKPETVQKRDILPRFCKFGVELSINDFLLLWDLGTAKACSQSPVVRRGSRRLSGERPLSTGPTDN